MNKQFMKLIFVIMVVISIGAFFGSTSTSPSVIIIGAGPSGIAAATRLLENSITNIIILEAEHRIGGRIYSLPLENGYVDLGAEFCHGEVGNVVFETVKDLDLLLHAEENTDVYYSNGSIINHNFVLSLLIGTVDYKSIVRVEEDKISLGESYLEWYNNTFISKYKNNTDSFKIVTEVIKLSEHLILSDEGSFNWYRTSANSHCKDCEGDQAMTWKTGGYHTILNILMKKIPKDSTPLPIDDKFVLNKTVIEIIWNSNKAQVKTSDQEDYIADHVIFTSSLGVLQNKNILFDPILPKKKRKAIGALGFDAVMKIILHFPQPWWSTYLLLLWSEEDLKNSAKEFPFGYNKNDVSWITSIYVLEKSPNPNVLIAWITGEMTPKVEKLSEDIIKKGVIFILRKFFGKIYNISEPDVIISTNWYSNPNFKGAYSYEKTKFYKKNVSYNALLAEPLTYNGKPILQFAGEATSPIHYSTVHGAIETGWREAQRIIDLYKH